MMLLLSCCDVEIVPGSLVQVEVGRLLYGREYSTYTHRYISGSAHSAICFMLGLRLQHA